MTPADWRQLIQAYLGGRLSAEAFARRFSEAYENLRRGRAVIPAPVNELLVAVEEFRAAQGLRDEGETNQDDLLHAAKHAEALLQDGAPTISGRTYDRARAREDFRRFQFQTSGCMGLGCLLIIVWVGLCLLQWSAVSALVQAELGWTATVAAIVGFILAFIPIIGNVSAFFGATSVWDWNPVLAGLVFFAAPLATMATGWMRWRRGP